MWKLSSAWPTSMTTSPAWSRGAPDMGTAANSSLGRAWLLLCVSLGAHVADEALTGFLSVYNPTVAALRARFPWWPMPMFGYAEWLAGLIVAVVVLLLLSVFVFRGARWMRPLAYVFAIIMLANGLAHTAGTIAGRTVAA